MLGRAMLMAASNSAAAAAAWTPAQITTALWFDASDSSTITTVSGAVSQWNDKSGNNRHATQAAASERPLLTTAPAGIRAVTGQTLVLSSTFSLSGDFTILIVANRASGSGIYVSLDSPSSISTITVNLKFMFLQDGTDLTHRFLQATRLT